MCTSQYAQNTWMFLLITMLISLLYTEEAPLLQRSFVLFRNAITHKKTTRNIQQTFQMLHRRVNILRATEDCRMSVVVPGAAVTKPPLPAIFCQVRVSHVYLTESMPPVIFMPTRVSHICSGGDFRKLQWTNELLKFKTKFVPAVWNRTESVWPDLGFFSNYNFCSIWPSWNNA